MGNGKYADGEFAELHELAEALQIIGCHLSAARRRSVDEAAVTLDKETSIQLSDQCARAYKTLHSLRSALRTEGRAGAEQHGALAGCDNAGTSVSSRSPAPAPLQRHLRLSNEARQAMTEIEQLRCKIWLRAFMQGRLPKIATKAELRDLAKQKLGVSKASFDTAWVWAIEETGRTDWYEPLRGKRARA